MRIGLKVETTGQLSLAVTSTVTVLCRPIAASL